MYHAQKKAIRHQSMCLNTQQNSKSQLFNCYREIINKVCDFTGHARLSQLLWKNP